jgi:hypothetical protein
MAEVPDLSELRCQLLTAIDGDAQHHSPPSLCHSSSSPVPDVLSFDFSAAAEESVDDADSSGHHHHHHRLSLKENVGGNADFDSFFDYANMGLDGGQDSFFGL